MTTKARCEKFASELNVTIDIAGGYEIDINLTTPKGFMFGNQCHAASGYADNMKEAWAGIWEDLKNVSPCDVESCETCNEVEGK